MQIFKNPYPVKSDKIWWQTYAQFNDGFCYGLAIGREDKELIVKVAKDLEIKGHSSDWTKIKEKDIPNFPQ